MGVLILLVTVLITAVIAFFVMSKSLSGGVNKEYYRAKWNEINATRENGESGAKLSIIEADKLLDKALQAKGFKGTKMSERLIAAESTLGSAYQTTWTAHKYRNRLVHEDVKLKNKDIDNSLVFYKNALKRLGVV